MAAAGTRKVLFVCLGNICRSPIAEAVFVEEARKRGVLDKWHVESAALGNWHVGCSPDPRATKVMSKRGVVMTHKAQQVKKEDFVTYDYIFGMDEENMKALRKLAPANSKAEILLLGTFDPQKKTIIRDPYYDEGDAGFEECYEQCVRCCQGFLDQHPCSQWYINL